MMKNILLGLCLTQLTLTVFGNPTRLEEQVGSCEFHTCEAGSHCELEQIVCCCAPCDPAPKCVPDAESTLDSPDTIPIRCRQGYMYILKTQQCDQAPCYHIPQCVPEDKQEQDD